MLSVSFLLILTSTLSRSPTVISADGGKRGSYGVAGKGGGGRNAIYAARINGVTGGLPIGAFTANDNPGPVPFIGSSDGSFREHGYMRLY